MLLHVDDGTQLHHFDSSDDIVRSVHLSADASRLALGSDRQGRGVARLYDANSNELLAPLPHDKPVWCVRLSNNGALLAVAGYDCKLTVYDCSSRPEDRNFCAPLQSIKYESTGGPAFIWSCAFSADNRMLALGCWNFKAYLYRVQHKFNARPKWHMAVERTLTNMGHGALTTGGLACGMTPARPPARPRPSSLPSLSSPQRRTDSDGVLAAPSLFSPAFPRVSTSPISHFLPRYSRLPPHDGPR